jgi:hypothetical protein
MRSESLPWKFVIASFELGAAFLPSKLALASVFIAQAAIKLIVKIKPIIFQKRRPEIIVYC